MGKRRLCCLCQFDIKNVAAAAEEEEEIEAAVKNTLSLPVGQKDSTAFGTGYEDISAKHIKCTVMRCTAFKSANQATASFGTQLSVLFKSESSTDYHQ